MINEQNNSIDNGNQVFSADDNYISTTIDTITEEHSPCTVDIYQANKQLEQKTESIVHQIIQEESLEGVQDLTHLFNITQVKKQVMRNLAYNNLLDKITNQMGERLDKRADQFSNKDLLDYAKVVQDGIDKAQKQIQSIDTAPMIQVNTQNNITIQSGDELDRESRQRVIEAAKVAMSLLMSQSQQQMSDISNNILATEEIQDDFSENLNTDMQDSVQTIDETSIDVDGQEDESFNIDVKRFLSSVYHQDNNNDEQ